MNTATLIHATAIIDPGAAIGPDTRIWHWTHVCAGAIIGARCNIGQNVFIADGVIIGQGCKIQNNVSVYHGVTLEEDVFCGPSMVFTNIYNPRAAVRKMDQVRDTLIRKGATLGANCTIVCGATIGRYAFIGAGTVIIRDVPDYALMVGNPARHVGWVSRYGERLELPLQGAGQATCPVTSELYRLQNNQLTLV